MANPPIVIGQFDNVPAPGSPIRSDWPQEISTAVTALQAAYPAILVGQSPTGGAQTVGTSATALTGLSTTFTAIAGARYVVLGQVGARQVGADGLIRMQIVASTPSAVIGGAWEQISVNWYTTLVALSKVQTPGAVSVTYALYGFTSAGTVTFNGGEFDGMIQVFRVT